MTDPRDLLHDHPVTVRFGLAAIVVGIGTVVLMATPRSATLDGVLLGVFAAVILVYASWSVTHTPRLERDPLPTPETTAGTAAPPDIEAALAGAHSLERAPAAEINRHRAAVVDGLRTAATELLVHRGHPPDRAAERVRAGRWTDDERAAELLDERTDVGVDWSERLEALATGRCPFHGRVDRAIDELRDVTTASSGTHQHREEPDER